MVAVFPDKLSFYKGLAPTQQRLAVTVEGEHAIVTVDPPVVPPAPGSEFRWTPSPAVGWKLGSPIWERAVWWWYDHFRCVHPDASGRDSGRLLAELAGAGPREAQHYGHEG
jgi:hypothetical protein